MLVCPTRFYFSKMKKFLIGTKQAMTMEFREDGTALPVTVIQAGPCVVTEVKATSKNGSTKVQLGFGAVKKQNKARANQTKGKGQFRVLHEFRTDDAGGLEEGKSIDASLFEAGDPIKVTGTSKGRGFQGVVKRHGFGGSPATHGHKDQLRMPGSIGSTGPQRVFKGVRMAGRMGGTRVTVRGLEVIAVDAAKNLVVVKGAVPGPRNGILFVESQS